MPTGTLSLTYELAIPNFAVVDPGPFTQQVAGPPRWTATLRPSDAGLELVIEIATDDPSNAAVAADNAAQTVAEYISFWLCDHDIALMVKPRRLGSPRFHSADPNTLHAFLGELTLVGEAVTVAVTHRVNGKSIVQLLADFAFRQAAPPPATANDIVIARQMYIAGLSVDNTIASFLITYAAAAVFATFKASTGALQSRIDAVLTAEDPTIPTLHRRTASGKTVSETEFTAARNVLLPLM